MICRYMFLRLFAALLFVSSVDYALGQILNAGFESWTNGNPDDWTTSNIPPSTMNITLTSGSHSGASAALGDVVISSGFAWPPTLLSGSDGRGFSVNAQHPAIHGWYKYYPIGGDLLLVGAIMLRADTSVGGGGFVTPDSQVVYREFVLSFFYQYPVVPDTCILVFTIVDTSATPDVGSTFIVDDLAFGPATSVDWHGNVIPNEFALFQNYPNPFNPTTMIQYGLPQARNVQLKVFDVLGREVAVLVDQRQEAGSYRAEFDASNLPNGTYFYRLLAGEFSQVKKLMLVK